MPWPVDRGAGAPGAPGSGGGETPCARVREWIDPYLDDLEARVPDPDGGIDPASRHALEAHAAGCPDCRAELALARRLRRGLRDGLPLLACPPEVTEEVLRVARAEARATPDRDPEWAERTRAAIGRWLGGGALRPALVAGALVLLVLAAPLLLRTLLDPNEAPTDASRALVGAGSEPTGAAGRDPDEFTTAEVAAAEEQVRIVLAYVAAIGRDAGRAVQEDVFDPGIARPTRQAVEGLQAAGLAAEGESSEAPADSTERNRP